MTDEQEGGGGPVPVRDLMQATSPAPEAEGEPRWQGDEQRFELEGVEWTVRTAGAGSYGTGEVGSARLLAVHFFRQDAPERPVREALLPAGRFMNLREEELRTLFLDATPIELED